MTPQRFLSSAWIEALNDLRASVPAPEQLPAVAINFVVNDAPSEVAADGTVAAALDTGSGTPQLTLEHHADPDVIVTADYEVARALLADADPAVAMAAFLGGRVLIQGEMIKLMTLFGALAADPQAADVTARIKAITT